MTGDTKVLYKGLVLIINYQHNYLEVVVDEENFDTQKKYISSASAMLEYALTIHPRYIILNRENYRFVVCDNLFPFTINNIIRPLKYDCVKRIICTGTEEEYQERYQEIEKKEPFIKWVGSKSQAVEWIKCNEVQLADS